MLNILIVDHHPIVRKGLELFCNEQSEYQVIGCLDNGLDIFDFVRSYKVDIIISEIDLPELNGITALRSLKKEHHNIEFLMFSYQPEEIYAMSALKAGALGYLHKTSSLDTIKKAIDKIQQGEVALSKKMALYYQNGSSSRSNMNNLYKKLSNREVEVLKLLSSGRKNKDIASELKINEKTVSTYKSRLFKKLNVENIVDLVHQAKHHSLV